MSSKASISTDTIFLIATISLFLIFTIISFWHWIHQVSGDATKASCTAKYINYCERWVMKGEDPGDWNDIKPIGCADYEIYKPDNIEKCKNLT